MAGVKKNNDMEAAHARTTPDAVPGDSCSDTDSDTSIAGDVNHALDLTPEAFELSRNTVTSKSLKNISPEDREWILWLDKRIGTMHLTDEDRVSSTLFKVILQLESGYEVFADRVFKMISSLGLDENETISIGEMMASLRLIATMSTPKEKLKFIFDTYDFNASGSIERHEFALVIQTLIDAQSLAISGEQIKYMTDTLFDEIDTDKSNTIELKELQALLEASPEGLQQLQLSASRLLRSPKWRPKSAAVSRGARKTSFVPRMLLKKAPNASRWNVQQTRTSPLVACIDCEFAKREPCEFIWLWIYMLAVALCYAYGALDSFRPYHIEEKKITTLGCRQYYALAHGFGFNLNFNVMLLILLMLRRTLTTLRNSPIGWAFPLDSHVFAHKLVGWVATVCVCGHVGMHFLHFGCLTQEGYGNFTYTEFLFSTEHQLGWIPGWICLTGWPLLAFHVIMFFCSLPVIRTSGYFEVFFYSHLLYVPYFIILILHSDKFWMFVVVPGVVFLFEKMAMSRCIRKATMGNMFVKEAVLWPTVTQLTIRRAANFDYKPGDYVFLNIPLLAEFEWHPFTISSNPERTNTLTLHIRHVGGWTTRLNKLLNNHALTCGGIETTRDTARHFSIQVESLPKRQLMASPSVVAAAIESGTVRRFGGRVISAMHLPVNIDGPYGAPSSSIYDAEYAVLVCAGIGVTPFASILQSIIHRYHAAKIDCPKCKYRFSSHLVSPQNRMALKRVSFVWVVRDNSSVEWFLDVLDSIEQAQLELQGTEFEHFIDIQIYVTAARKMADLAQFAFVSALDLVHRKTSRCALTGLRNPARPGRPDWDKVFGEISVRAKMRDNVGDSELPVTVFFCGPPALGDSVRAAAERKEFRFRKEVF